MLLAKALYAWDKAWQPEPLKRKWALAQDMQRWPLERIREWQWQRVMDLLRHAYTAVPYYRSLFDDRRIRPEDVRSWADFAQLPILTKPTIQAQTEQLRAEGVPAFENRTGGSTGHPLHFYQDVPYREWGNVSKQWANRLCGFHGGEKQLYLWGSDFDAKGHETLRGRLHDWRYNIQFVNAFNLTDRQLQAIARELAAWQPDFIWGYASTLGLLADQLLASGLQLKPTAVQSTAGTLYPSLRTKLEQVFGRVVFDRYGSREFSIVAHDCAAHEGLHEFCPGHYVEVVGGADGEPGQLVITNLHNRAFPFIRYAVGDLAVRSVHECSCGSRFPMLARVVGRTVEIISSPSGKLIDGEFFTHLFYKVEGVSQFQVVQTTRNELVIRLVKGSAFQSDALAFLETTIKSHGDPAFHIRFEFVEQIPPLSSGKIAFVLSQVPIELR